MKWLVRALVFCGAFALAIPAVAHPVPFSYLDLQLQPDFIEVSLVAHIYDLAHDLGISPIERLLEPGFVARSEEHTSELQSRGHLVCRLLLEKKKSCCHAHKFRP